MGTKVAFYKWLTTFPKAQVEAPAKERSRVFKCFNAIKLFCKDFQGFFIRFQICHCNMNELTFRCRCQLKFIKKLGQMSKNASKTKVKVTLMELMIIQWSPSWIVNITFEPLLSIKAVTSWKVQNRNQHNRWKNTW